MNQQISLRYLLLKKIDNISFNIEHASELEYIIRNVKDINFIESPCLPTNTITQIYTELTKNSNLLFPIPSEQMINSYLHRINTVLLIATLNKNKDLWKKTIDTIKEVLNSRVVGNIVPLLSKAMYDRVRLILLMVDYSLFQLVHPTLGIDSFNTFKTTTSTSTEVSLMEKIYNKNKDIAEFWLEWIRSYVMQNTIGANVLRYKLERGYVLQIANLLEKHIQNGRTCNEKIGVVRITDFLFDLLKVPYVYKLWPSVSECFSEMARLVGEEIEE